ncbi:MAG: tRNA (adenosine(37)-N6)-threonylcarbamoyltransferase complex transferase subunit TsaD, partial [Fimbriimonadaceae bacterium]|nr:tRNA (adenosine(37)-N6)-threonylcarbamoyltransferase complex transferase subunit TsaD [Fimbriimonadaceae bacterium]
NIVASQVEMHAKWGGIVPEAAARAHVEAILPVIQEALAEAGIQRPTALCVTSRPGLVGALAIGISATKALALGWGIPFLGVHHLEGHILSTFCQIHQEDAPPFPHLALVASGGHTEVVWVKAPGDYQIVAQTLDDAAGEALDKGARLLGLGYPGGRRIQEMAAEGNPKRYPLPQGVRNDPTHFSFSGVKTAMLRLVQREGDALSVPDAAASLQRAVVGALATKIDGLLEEFTEAKALTLVGGVAANLALRERLHSVATKRRLPDNAAMIGLAGSWRLAQGQRSDLSLDASPSGSLESLLN